MYLSARAADGTWTAPEQVPQDPANCNKIDVSATARDGRVGLAYVLGYTGFRATSRAAYNVVHVLTGAPGNWSEARLALPTADTSCTSPALAGGGSFGLVMSCGHGEGVESGNLYYTAQAGGGGPIITSLTEILVGARPGITMRWSSPAPGSGRYGYTVQVSAGSGPWQPINPAGQSATLRAFQVGQSYTFKVCAYTAAQALIGCAERSVRVD